MTRWIVNKSIYILFFSGSFRLSSKQWIDFFFSNKKLVCQKTWVTRAMEYEHLTFSCPFYFFALFLPFPFPGFEYFPDGGEFAFPLGGRGVLCGGTQCGWLHFTILFLVCEGERERVKKKSNTLNNQYPFVIIFLLM